MFKAVVLCAVLVGAFAENVAGGAKEEVGKGYGNVYQGQGGYGAPFNGQIYPQPPVNFAASNQQFPYPQFGFPGFTGLPINRKFDTHYCSVHGSFAFAGVSDNQNATPLQNNNNAGNPYGTFSSSAQPAARQYSRQFCRYATNTYENCAACCKIAARVSNTSPDNISAAIFSFDPDNLSANGALVATETPLSNNQANNGPYRKKRAATSSGVFKQCVCCAPKQDF